MNFLKHNFHIAFVVIDLDELHQHVTVVSPFEMSGVLGRCFVVALISHRLPSNLALLSHLVRLNRTFLFGDLRFGPFDAFLCVPVVVDNFAHVRPIMIAVI